MMVRPAIVLGVLLLAGTYAATKDLERAVSHDASVAGPDRAAPDGQDDTWPSGAVTAQPEQIFQD